MSGKENSMPKLKKTDEFQERIGILIDRSKAGLMELKAGARKVRLEARLDYDKGIKTLEKKQGELKTVFGEWQKAGQSAGRDLRKRVEDLARDLQKTVEGQLKKIK
jgi:gas vesicle protein